VAFPPSPPCAEGEVETPVDPLTCACVDPCDAVTCLPNQECRDGRCLDCRDLGCDYDDEVRGDEVCEADETGAFVCQPDLCFQVECDEGEDCVAGQCVGECSPACSAGQICVAGACCTINESNCRGVACPVGVCNPDDGSCIPDPCPQTKCAAGRKCVVACGGQAACVPIVETLPPDFVAITGEGGCGCRTGGAPGGGGAALLSLLLLVAGLRRRR
jgi:MYXO-CTERM domain-containing protein